MNHAVKLANVNFDYGEDFSLCIAELSLKKGEMALISGGSGSGKSTLLWLIAGLLRARSGSITVAGQRMDGVSESAADRIRASHIGLVFQTHHLLPEFSAQDNVALALMAAGEPEKTHATRARELLEKLGIERVHVPVANLSVGQQQRVAVARAIVCKPTIVLADEPTASLDEMNATQAMDLIQQACREAGAALLCASHDRAMQSRFERVIQVDSFVTTKRAHTKSGARA
ncbi:MAG: ATP-binding cassette domain-containing protein [Phycisphaerales bacterium]|nr:ATP-binding cassette domain-containing protein [Phycisphaerales bacterium]